MPDQHGNAITRTDLRAPVRRGKVRDVYELPGERLLIVATDRISAFDVVLPTPIPGKGVLLTEIAGFWLRWIAERGLCGTHLLSADACDLPASLLDGQDAASLAGRVTIGRRCRVLPVEFVVRGYLEGSGWRDYQRTGSVCGVALPGGLWRCERLPEPIFTPATKAPSGLEGGAHDENIGFERASEIVDSLAGAGTCERLRRISLAIYATAHGYAAERGLLLADTKFEFGLPPDGGEPILIDEALTPDSSRWWPADRYEPGRAQSSFDKQYVREYLETLVASGAWDKSPPGPELPPAVVEGTLSRYREARDRLLRA